MKNIAAIFSCAAIVCAAGFSAHAAVPVSDVTQAYDQAVKIQDEMDSLDVSVTETTAVPGVKDNTRKTISIQASGLQHLDNLKAAVTIKTDEGEKDQYYTGGYFYEEQSGKNIKYAMKPEDMLEIMNYYVYLDLDSTRLVLLEQDGDSYLFNATQESLGNYTDKILEGAQEEHHIQIVALQGTVDTDGGNIIRRSIQTVYTMKSGDEPQTCTVNTRETFRNPGQAVTVEIPDLSGYSEKAEETVVTVTELSQTVYATDDINVRAQNNVSSAILGGASMGDPLQETGYTSDGWTQISYNGAVAFVSSDYVSTKRPVVTKDMSGTMYATVDVNVRSDSSTSGAILGMLEGGDSVKVTGYTNNNWIRVNYNNQTGYVSSSYLTWDQPVTAMGGTMYVVNDLANVRAYYSTDSAVLATISRGDAVEVTGYTPNNWIRIKYQGNTGYIYGDLLSWNRPQKFSYGYAEGYVSETSRNTVTLMGSDGNVYTFSASDAVKRAAGGVSDGDNIAVYYTDRNGTLTATEIDMLSGGGASDVNDDAGVVYGTVVSSGIEGVTIACDDGQTRTFDKSSAYIDCPNGMYVGLYVQAGFYYDNARGYVLDYLLTM